MNRQIEVSHEDGHPFDEENTYVDSEGRRSCRACRRRRNRERAKLRFALALLEGERDG